MQISNQTTIVVRFFGNGYSTCSFSVRYSAKKKSVSGCYFFDRLLHSLTEYEEKNCKSTAKLRIATSLKCGKV